MLKINVLLACLMMAGLSLSAPVQAAISSQPWGTTADDGRAANLYTLTNAKGMRVRITNYGGVIVSIDAPGRDGKTADVVQGFDSLADYTSADYLRNNGHYGSIIGRFANRIRGATDHAGRQELCAGCRQEWRSRPGRHHGLFPPGLPCAAPHDGAEPSLVLTHTDPDGFMGFPGTVQGDGDLHADPQQYPAHRLPRHHRQEDGDQPDQPFLFQHGRRSRRARSTISCCRFSPTTSRRSTTRASRPARSATWREPISISRKPTALGPRLASTDPQIADQERTGSQFRDRRRARALAPGGAADRSGFRPAAGGMDHPARRADL